MSDLGLLNRGGVGVGETPGKFPIKLDPRSIQRVAEPGPSDYGESKFKKVFSLGVSTPSFPPPLYI